MLLNVNLLRLLWVVLEPTFNYTRHWTRGRSVLLMGVAVLVQLGTTLVQPFEMRVAFLWRVRVRGETCLKRTRLSCTT